MSISPSPKKARLSRSASSGVEVDSNVQYLKDRISSKLGVGIDSKVNKQKKKDQIISDTKVEKGNRVILRTGSLSPTVKTTVIAAPASETKVTRKTSIERKSSVAPRSRIDQDVTARLAKSTELRSPGEVKKVLKQREVKERSSTSKSLPPGTVVKSSTTLYSSSSRGLRKPKEDKQLKVTVAISAKGRELLSSSVSSSSGLKDDLKLHKKTEADNTSSTITSPSSAAATVASTSVGSQPITSLSPTGSKSPRPLSQSDSDKRPSSRSTGQNSPVARDIKSPVGKITTLPTVVVSPVPSSDPIKKIKKADSSPEVPKKKKDKIGSASVSKSPLLRNGSNKKSTKDNDSDNNGKKKSKKSKDGDSPPSSKKLTKKSSTKKSREKNNVKRISENPSESDPSTGCKDRLVVVPVGQISSSEFPDVNITSMPGKGFFQNLLLRNLPSPTPSNVSTLQRNTSVLERAKKFYRSNEHSSLPYRSEPSLRLINVYLSQKKPVSESKFRSLDREITSNRSSRSQSPLFNRSRRYEFLEKIDKFDRINNVWDRSNGYYSPLEYRSRSPELYKERSSSEPPRTSPTQQNEPQEDIYEGINNAHWDYENMSPTHSRSPSCRRIRSTRSAIKTIESIGGLKRKGVRTKSLSEADSKRSFPQVQTQSTSSLNLAHLTDHHDYQTYVMELLHSTKKSDRFKELHKFYASLERMGELERTTSNTDLRPRKKGEEVIDYDRWKQLRTKERAEEELRNIYEKLKEDQKEKDLLFQPKDSESIKWKGDIGLRSKEKSVEDLRHRFQKMAYEDSDIELCKRKALNATKDTYKPLWRGSSVVNLANTLVHRTKRNRSASEVDQTVSSTHRATSNQVSRSIGSRLWSSLSMEQVNALKNQLSEIYSTVSSLKRDRINRMLQGKSHDRNCEIVIHPKENCRAELPEKLQVRCNSLLTKEQLYSPLNQRREAQRKECKKADSISSIPNWKDSRDSSSLSGDSSHSQSSLGKPLSESEKKKLSMTLSQEVKNRVTKRCTDEKKKKRRVSSSIVIPRETMGAVAAIKGSKQTVRTKSPSASDISPRTCYSIEMSEEGSFTKQTSSLIDHDKRDFLLVLTPKDDNLHEVRKVVDNWAESKPQKQDDKVVARLVQTTSNSETDSGSSDASTVIHLGSREDVQKKVNYFEKKTGKDNDLFDGRVSRSVGDMRSFHQEIKHRAKSAPSTFTTDKSKSNLALSQSFSDIKELFGEKRASEYATTQLRKLKHPKTFDICRVKLSERNSQGVDSGLHSSEESLPIRSRSISPDPMKYYRAYLSMVKAGDVRKLRDKFESLDDLYTITDEENLNEPCPPPKRYQSDPDLTREFFARKEPIICKTIVRGQEVGDVKWLKKRYEHNPHRGRSKIPRVVSPVPLKSDNRFMPHINVISKLATLQQQRSQPTPPARPDPCVFRTGEVDRLRHQFEAQQELSLLGQMYTSTPDVRELRDIAPYLECNWVAHQYPKPRSLSSPETQRSPICSPKTRSASSSPIRRQTASILKHQQKKQNVFSNQHFDPSIHRPLYRYQPPSPSVDTSYHYRPWTRDPYWWWRHWWYPSTKPTVTFKEPVRGRVPAAPTPLRSYSAQQRPESPHRYVESEVTIHYRSPVRSEEKEAWPEEELQRRQAEAMRRIYQEERRRKYLQELQDMYSRRHTDNFIPSQKSPIPLNRYDDFVDDSSPGRPRDRTPEPKLVARALYNFVGQSLRELTFRRGDIIYVRRQIDKNWYEGEHNAMIGLFPINYVEIIPYDGIRTVPKRPTEGQARAKFNFQAQTHLELPLVKGELIVLTRRVDNNWFEGRIGTRKGIFPVSYVEVLVEPGERAMSPVRVNTPTKPVASPAAHSLHMGSVMSQHHYTPPRPVSYTSLPRQKATELKQPPVNQTLHIDTQNDPVPYRVLYNYKPQNEDELELVEGETVYVMEKCDDGWYVGSSQRTGYLGTFPGNYVERIV
ncbi:uncharacterized protein LOC128986471 isoform X7 [Macrosteles quadrilineatus]|uniref:uncharacterized protein LOC128986471 isoform X7 n=1 Tax=Macrosteles quadrilineatus TaxID=74068 RepID=UPI0023E0D52F|nr:uncharacterized protein LOC128986471 isoform X7 [Macrosteles quadrilineatus]